MHVHAMSFFLLLIVLLSSCILSLSVVVALGVGSVVSALSFDYSATYLAMGTADGHVRVAVVKDWSEPLVSGARRERGRTETLVDSSRMVLNAISVARISHRFRTVICHMCVRIQPVFSILIHPLDFYDCVCPVSC